MSVYADKMKTMAFDVAMIDGTCHIGAVVYVHQYGSIAICIIERSQNTVFVRIGAPFQIEAPPVF